MKLDAIETRSAVWIKLHTHLRSQLQSLRERNDGTQLDAIETARLRGRIAQVKEILALGQPEPGQSDGTRSATSLESGDLIAMETMELDV